MTTTKTATARNPLSRWHASASSSMPATSSLLGSAIRGNSDPEFSSSSSSVPTESPSPHSDNDNSSHGKLPVHLVLIDHYDSYTYNLYDMLASCCETPPTVVSKDTPVDELWPLLESCTGIVLSPGPGRPTCPEDMGHTLQVIRSFPHKPMLGVCLGHQAMGHVYGSNDTAAATTTTATVTTNDIDGPVHGQVHRIDQVKRTTESAEENDDLWKGLPSSIDVTRYHSLIVRLLEDDVDVSNDKNRDSNNQDSSLSSVLEATAWYTPSSSSSDDDDAAERVLMGLRHKIFPHHGVQFHPESIGTPHGAALLQNFVRICHQWQQEHQQDTTNDNAVEPTSQPNGQSSNASSSSSRPTHRVMIRSVQHPVDPSVVYDQFYSNVPHAVWLDSSSSSSSNPQQDDDTTAPGARTARSTTTGTTNDKNNDDPPFARFSIMGGMTGPDSRLVEYYIDDVNGSGVRDRTIHETFMDSSETTIRDTTILDYLESKLPDSRNVVVERVGVDMDTTNGGSHADQTTQDALPFDFRGGFLGYLGYEARHDTTPVQPTKPTRTATVHNKETVIVKDDNGGDQSNHQTPTAAFLYCDQTLVYDHFTGTWYILALSSDETGESTRSKQTQWMDATVASLLAMSPSEPSFSRSTAPPRRQRPGSSLTTVPPQTPPSRFTLRRSKTQYEQDIAECHENIRVGESYELCLTNQLEATFPITNDADHNNHNGIHEKENAVDTEQLNPLELYKILRKRNPAPFAAFLTIGAGMNNTSSLSSVAARNRRMALCCSSPERFVSVKRARCGTNGDTNSLSVEAKPIKGTIARPRSADYGSNKAFLTEDKSRAQELHDSIKERAENLMIVDLLRNDLSRVCRIGSVHVPKLMHIETYATVHQMVSTIRGTIDRTLAGLPSSPSSSSSSPAIRVLRACFPGGSMTGAPKVRTMEILDELEQAQPRGPYSGCLGYISIDGCMDMNIVIRSAVLTSSPSGQEWKVSVGAGGAITALSDTQDEYSEMLLKAGAVVDAVDEWGSNGRTGSELSSEDDGAKDSTDWRDADLIDVVQVASARNASSVIQ